MIVAPDTRGSAHLDLARGIAALAVFVGHARNLFLVDYPEVSPKKSATQVLYAATTFGHQAVIVFFVLSGFFITTSVARQSDRWSWTSYLIDRLCRLHIVLVPALLATAAWDWAGMHAGGNRAIYDGTADNAVVTWPVAQRLDAFHFGVNFCYSQTIFAPPFGSNGPLWSLAYEFWYYTLFPAILLTFRGQSWAGRLAHAALAVLVAWLVGPAILLLFPAWLVGSAIRYAPPLGLPGWAVRLATWFAGAGIAAALLAIASRVVGRGLTADYLLAGAFGLWVYLAAHDGRPAEAARAWRAYARFAAWLAGFSYTLYLVHVPVLVFARSQLVAGSRWQPSSASLGCLAVLLLGVVVYAWLFSLLTERHTARMRRLCRHVFRLERREPARPELAGLTIAGTSAGTR